MPGEDLQRRLADLSRQLQASADDAALGPAALRATARASAAALSALEQVASTLAQALASAQDGERRERRRAEHDSLTELPNRDGFDRRLNGALGTGGSAPRALAVLFLDLDEFKRVNDGHGHAVGDALLREVGQRLRRSMRAGDLVCRLGGDEFACVVDGPIERPEIARLADKLIATVSAPLHLGAVELSVRPSVGIAMCPGDGADAAALLQHADAAMFRAKQQGCGMAFFEPHQDVRPPCPAGSDRRAARH